jgi:hypothetical protein
VLFLLAYDCAANHEPTDHFIINGHVQNVHLGDGVALLNPFVFLFLFLFLTCTTDVHPGLSIALNLIH